MVAFVKQTYFLPSGGFISIQFYYEEILASFNKWYVDMWFWAHIFCDMYSSFHHDYSTNLRLIETQEKSSVETKINDRPIASPMMVFVKTISWV